MSQEIINRVANSKLKVIDLEDLYPEGKRVLFDISDWLFKGLLLKEKDFRLQVKNHNWLQYKNCYVALTCTTEAIIPSWAYMLISVNLAPYVEKIIVGKLPDLEASIYQDIISNLDCSEYINEYVIIKGCSEKPIPQSAFTQIAKKIQPFAKSIMFGEACSSVPLYKKQ